MKKPRRNDKKYHEGEKARDNFERIMVALFRAPKTKKPQKGKD